MHTIFGGRIENMAKKKYTLEKAKKYISSIKTVVEVFEIVLEAKRQNENILDIRKFNNSVLNKQEEYNIEYQTPAAIIARNYINDRKFPIETVLLQSQEIKRKEEIGKVILHTGSYADEYARSHHALALVVGTDVFFRNGAYKPETEEGRKIIAHELTHVTQYKNRPFVDNRTREDLEEEAIKEENKENSVQEEITEFKIQGKTYKISKKDYKKLVRAAENELENWILEQSDKMNEREYVKLLNNYKKYKEEREFYSKL